MPDSRITKAISSATKVKPNEFRATVLSFLFVFTLMAAYFIVRPARDALASDWTDVQLSTLWTFTFIFSVIAVSVYGGIISRLRFKIIVPSVYAFFALTFVGFWIAGNIYGNSNDMTNRAFYVWLSVFSLFHLSVFWTFMSGVYNKEQAKRLYAVIALGATAGTIAGSAVSSFFTEEIGRLNLLLLSSGLLLLSIPLIGFIERLRGTDLGNEDLQVDLTQQRRLAKNPFSGFTTFVSSPYLLAIGGFIIFYVIMNTFIYFELRDVLRPFDDDIRTQYWARIDLAVNLLTAFIALFATGRLATRAGMPTTLALVPLLMIGGWLIVAVSPVMGVLIGLQIARRAGNYAITRPGREMLFTIVDADTRFKAKPVVDIVVYRGGDVATAWFYTAVTATLGLGLAGVALVSAAICALWAGAGVYLGRKYDARETAHAAQEHSPQ